MTAGCRRLTIMIHVSCEKGTVIKKKKIDEKNVAFKLKSAKKVHENYIRRQSIATNEISINFFYAFN